MPFPERVGGEIFLKNPPDFSGDDRLRRFASFHMCSVEVEWNFVKIHLLLRAKKSVVSPYANAFGLVPAVA